MTSLKFPTMILASVFALTQPSRTCAQTTPPAPPQTTPAQQAAASAKVAEQAAKEAQDAANTAQAAAKAQEAATAAADARQAADAAKNAKDPQEAVKDAQQAITDAQEAEEAAAAAQSLASPAAGCIAKNDARTGSVKGRWRPQAGEDYFKLEYDVSSHQMMWFDYKHQGTPPGIEVLNGALLPVVYSREKVLVHVNCLHPTDTVSITTNDIALPEQGADVRGVTSASTVTALAPTLDSLGSASAAGTALGTPGFGFGPPPTLPTGTTSLFTPGTSKDGSSYTDAVINIAPEDLAIETGALVDQIMDAINSYNEMETGKITDLTVDDLPDAGSEDTLLEACSTPPADADLPGSVCGLQVATQKLFGKLSQRPSPTDESLSEFNDYLAQTQTLVSQLNGLATGLNQAGLTARAIAIRQNMEVIVGLLAEVRNTYDDDLKYNKNRILFADTKQTISTGDAICKEVYDAIYNGDAVAGVLSSMASDGTKSSTNVKTNPPDTPNCHAMEQYIMDQFLRRYDHAVQRFRHSSVELMSENTTQSLPALKTAINTIPTIKLSQPGQNASTSLTKGLETFEPVNNADGTKAAAPPRKDEDFIELLKNANNLQKEPIPVDSKKELSRLTFNLGVGLFKSKAYPSLTAPTAAAPEWIVDIDPTENAADRLFKELLSMRSEVASLDQRVGEVFENMNNRYQNTWVDQTDALPPLTSNTIVRVGINVQRNYTPFTLTGGSAVGTAAAAPGSQPSASGSPGGGQQGGGQGGGQQGGGQQGGGKGSQSNGQQSSSQSPSTSPSGATSTTGSNDFTVLMEVHRFANFNLVGGVMAIHVKNYSFAAEPEYVAFTAGTGVSSGSTNTPQYTYSAYVTCPPGSNVTMTTSGAVQVNGTSGSASVTPSPGLYYCLNQTQTASLQPAGMVGIAWFPWHRDYFPRGRGALFQGKDLIPSFMAASAVTSLGSVFFGPNFEPINGLDLYAGWGTSNVTGLAKGTSLNQVLLPQGSSSAAPTINTATHVKGGITFGVGFDISVFLQLFGKAQGPSLP